MNDPLTLAVVDALHGEGIAFFLVGSFSSNLYGIPRSTRDADFVVELGDRAAGILFDRMRPAWKTLPQDQAERIAEILAGVDGANKLSVCRIRANAIAQRRLD